MYSPHIPIREALATELDHFAWCVKTGSRPLTDGINGLDVVKMLECATLSMHQRGHPIELEPMRVAS